MTALAIFAALGPLSGSVAALAGARARLAGLAEAGGAAVALGCSLALLVLLDGRVPLVGWDGFLYVDSLGGFFLMTVAGVTSKPTSEYTPAVTVRSKTMVVSAEMAM